MVQRCLRKYWMLPVLMVFFTSLQVNAQFEAGVKDPFQIGVIQGTAGFPASNTVTINATQGETSKKIENIIRLKFNELAPTSTAQGAPLLYFKSSFQATATLSVGVWSDLSVNNTPTPDQTLTPTIPLTVTYDLTTGNTYNPVAYWLLQDVNGKGYQQVKVTVTAITVSGTANGWTSANVTPLLTVENEMRVWRYFSTPALAAPAITPIYDGVNHPDQLSVSWLLPVGANTSHLEFAWVENETKGYYNVNGTFNTDKLFQTNSTRVEIDTSGKIFNIPLLYDADPLNGGGTLYYRVRSVLRNKDGSIITGAWGTPQTFANNGHEASFNWQSATSFAENGKSKTVIQYFDGTLRPRQTVTRDNSTGNTTVAETIYDLQGRQMVQLLPTPTLATVIDYVKDFNRFSGQTTNDDPAKYFDLAVAGSQCNAAPALDTSKGNGIYYSANNLWKNTEAAARFIPNAGGYGYTETRYTDDATERISSQGGVGKAHQIGSGHETKYYYGKPNQNELDALFGTEVGDASHYFKNMVQDANGQLSVSYVDMHGRTIATALAGAKPTQVADISANTAFYPSSAQLTGNLITSSTNIIKGDSIQAINSILVSSPGSYTFYYQLTPALLQQFNTNAQQICFDCKYDLEISIRQEDCSDAVPIVRKYNNLQMVPAAQACTNIMGFTGDNGTTPQTQISFSVPLTIGSWIVRKSLTINDSAFRIRRDSALKSFLFITQQHINDSVFTALSTTTSCNTKPAVRNCSTCQASIGANFAAYKANYLISVGGTTTLTDAVLQAQYLQDSTTCANACAFSVNQSMTTLAAIRYQMLADMTPYTGQYALPLDSIGSLTFLQAKYNIFTASYNDTHAFGQFTGTTKPFYLTPVTEPSGATGSYLAADGTIDNTIYPLGQSGVLTNVARDSFANLFNNNWANQLIYYHPEYKKLYYAENTLKSTYKWLDSVLQCDTYAEAQAQGFTTPLTRDPYFVNNYVPADVTAMQNSLTKYIGNAGSNPHLSIWEIANGQALCDSTAPSSIRAACTASLDSTKLDINAVTTAQKDAVWRAFKSTYLGIRNDMVVTYINNQQIASLSQAAMDTLQIEGKQLRFANNASTSKQIGITWWATATNTVPYVDSTTMVNIGNAAIAANSYDQCVAQRPFWKSKLLQCEILKQYLAKQTNADSLTVTNITNAILDSMVMVCHNSIDANNTSGATNVNPALLPKTPANFEDIVNHVFNQYGIATLPGNNYLCNPYTIDYPKPYNTNMPVYSVARATADTCNCQQLSYIKTIASGTGVDTTSLAAMNTYIMTNYGDTLSNTLWQGLLQCYSHFWIVTPFCGNKAGCPGLVPYYAPILLADNTIIPPFLNCSYSRPCISCAALQTYTTAFRSLYPVYAGVPYSIGVDTGQAKQNALWARYLNYKTGLNANTSQYIAAFLTCASGSGASVIDLILTNRSTQPPSGSTAPYSYIASNSILLSPGYSSLAGDNFTIYITTGGGLGPGGNALCSIDKPAAYVALPDTTYKNTCQAVQYEAAFVAQVLFQQQRDSLSANFDSLYRAKCLGVQSVELFTYSYAPKEYHYTLYDYDQAGNLLKTLPPAAVKPNFNATYLSQVQAARTAGTDLLNGSNYETMATQYRYNTLNQVVAQQTPDAGQSKFWYDRLGRLVVSQNAKQSGSSYSYTLYDYLGRITEVGQKPHTTVMTQTISQDTTQLKNWLANLVTGGLKQQITRTGYDEPLYASIAAPGPLAGLLGQINLRNRVSCTQVIDVENNSVPAYRAATFYSYDVHGNVDSLLQDFGISSVMGVAGNRFKLLKYEYDLISGKVNQVTYQPGKADGFYHQYRYDAENRITAVMTSRDSIFWQSDAAYSYYRHGPLARTTLGDLQVQGLDYAYTLHGWLKSVNPSYSLAGSDLMDADGTTTPPLFARDVYKFNLNYYDDGVNTDYTPIAPPVGYVQGNALPTAAKSNLYNGNISSMAVSLRPITALSTALYAAPMIYNYGYDQLNRISSMDAWPANGSFAPLGTTPPGDFAERYGYDPNGNILALKRRGTSGNGGQFSMDSLTYKYAYAKTTGGFGEYIPGQAPPADLSYFTNRLSSVGDGVAATNYPYAADPQSPADIDNQAVQNYTYDAIGNLTGDTQEGITGINWNVYGKILTITKAAGTITYTYDAAGNRISKNYLGITTCYVRDATGNVMSVYVQGDNTKNSGALTQTEVHLYGSSRLGILNAKLNCSSLGNAPLQTVFTRGSKVFEMSNHLGNVLVTISDKKIGHDAGNGTIDYYNADVVTASDFYSFGMVMPGRKYQAGAGLYRYGFNGQEKSDEIKGEGNSYTAEFWEYDPRIGRRWNIDPEEKKYPNQSPYSAFDNSPIYKNDPKGTSGIVTIDKQSKTITVTSRFTFYGNESTDALSNKIVKNIEDQWNAANGTVKIQVGVNKKGKAIYESYKVKFNFDASETRNQYDIGDKILSAISDTKSLSAEINSNTDYRNNYIRVEKNTSQGVSYYDATGSNTGVFMLDNVKNANSTTESHEYGHGLGLIAGTPDGHPLNLDLRGNGQPGIMYPRGTLVDAGYTYSPTSGASTLSSTGQGLNTLNPEKRKVTQSDIDALGLDKLKFNASGQATIGTLTNQYHKKGD